MKMMGSRDAEKDFPIGILVLIAAGVPLSSLTGAVGGLLALLARLAKLK